ncbi:hypothetical protein [Streptosporangium longisporum]|uniref:Uncharacterized protein n=1 Tax=Streptosporangium longisporum TaxID=46187 RepID=A0ABP6L4K7_9ACTN
MAYKTETERYARALPPLTQARDDVAKAIAEAHPAEGCLPIPPIEVPASADAVHDAVKEMCNSLWINNGSQRHPAWIAARTGCTHICETQVLNVYEVLVEWYRLLSKVHYYVNDVPIWADWRAVEDRGALDCELRVLAEFPAEMAKYEAGLSEEERAEINGQLWAKTQTEFRLRTSMRETLGREMVRSKSR